MAKRSTRASDEELMNDPTFKNILGDDDTNDDTEQEDTEDEEASQADASDDDSSDEGSDDDGSGESDEGEPTQQAAQAKGANGTAARNTGQDEVSRRVYNDLKQRLQPVFNKLEQRAREAETKLAAFQEANQVLAKVQMAPGDVAKAVQLFSELRNNPVKTLEHLLTTARAAGHNVGAGQGGAVDHNAIRSMITESLAPLTQNIEQQKRFQEAQQQASQQITDFYANYPDAQVHEVELAEILKRRPDMGLQDAYIALYRAYAQNGWDWNLPLSETGATNQQQVQQNTTQRRPLNNRGSNISQPTGNRNTNRPLAAPETRWGDIIKEEMLAAGIDVSTLG